MQNVCKCLHGELVSFYSARPSILASLPLDVCRTAVLDLTCFTYAPVVCFFSNRTFRNYSAASSMLKKALTLEVAFIEALRWERVLISKTVYNSPNM